MISLRQVLSGLLAMAFLVVANPSQADLVDRGSSVLDTNTGLEWLKMDETKGRSAYQIAILGAEGFYADGWVHATVDQIETLFINAAIPAPFDGTQSMDGFDGANQLINLLGSTGSFGNSISIFAFSGPVPEPPYGSFPPLLPTPVVITSFGTHGGADSPGPSIPLNVENPTIGNYLIREAVAPIDIDIKPGTDPNSINCKNEDGVIAVAILTTYDFDAMMVDHTMVTFEGVGEIHLDQQSGEPQRHEEDVDGDGDIDLVLHFRLGETDLTCDSVEATLTGETFDGQAIEGTDSVRMVEGGGT
jgi:hypothetical protein